MNRPRTSGSRRLGGTDTNRHGRGRKVRHPARRRLAAASSVAAVVLVVATLVGVKLARGSGGGLPRQPAPAAAVAALTHVPLSALRAAATKVSGLEAAQATSGPPLIAATKPELLFISAEFCPICATERWPMVVALSHFGTFSNLSQTHSAVSDGDISTLSFYGSTFTSPYLTFVPVETTTNQPSGGYYRTLETPTPSEMAVWEAAEGQQLAFPFLDIGGKWLLETAQYPYQALEGHSFANITKSISHGRDAIGTDVDASAAVLIKDICAVTGQQPATICHAVAGVSAPNTSTPGASSPAR